MYGKILQKLLQNFFLTMGRAPSSAAEWSKLRRQAMELARKEEGIPSITKNTTLQDLMTGPHMSDGPKGQRIWDFSKDLPTRDVLGKSADIIPFPKGQKFQKMSRGIQGLMKKGDVKLGQAPKTTEGILKTKKDRGILLRDADEDIARIKRENKEAVDRFRRKMNPDEPDKFQFGGIAPLVGEPSYAADFYDDRIPMAGGGALKKFIERLFIKASNDIRLGRGKWKGLDQKQRIVQHDNLTKKVTEFQKSGNTEGLEVYFGVNPNEAFAAASQKASRLGKRGPHWKEREVKAQQEEAAQKFSDEMDAEMWDAGRDAVDSLTGDKEVLKRVKMGQKDAIKQKVIRDERTALKTKYPGISDDLVEKILVDDNPQRKADVIGTIDDYMKLREVGKSEAEAYDIITRSFSKNPTKHAEGGRIGFNPGGPVDHDALVQMYLAEGLSYEEAVQAAQSAANLPWDTLKKAEGGIMREGHIFGGSAGLKAMWKQIMKGLSKGRDKPVTKLFPKLSAEDRAMEKVVMGHPEQKAFRLREKELKTEGIDLLINRLKHDKKILERQAKNKKMGDPGLDFLMKNLEKSFSEAYGPHLKKYTDIDKDILDMEND